MNNFEIDETYLTNVSMTKEIINPDPEKELVYRLMYGRPMISHWFEDHPEFAKLRDQLEVEGFIRTQRGWSNGDVVLKPFLLNGQKFKKNDRFVCAAAMAWHIKSKFKK